MIDNPKMQATIASCFACAKRKQKMWHKPCTAHQMSKIFKCLGVFVVINDLIPVADGYYCDHNHCHADQYCCGENLCCEKYVYRVWSFWAGVFCVVLLLSACAGFFRYCWLPVAPQVIVTRYIAVSPSAHPDGMQPLLASEDVPEGMMNPPPYSDVASQKCSQGFAKQLPT